WRPTMAHPFETCVQPLDDRGRLFSLPELARRTGLPLQRLPISIRILLEAVLRNCDGERVREDDVLALAGWQPTGARTSEVPFIVSRVLLQDFTGVPLVVDLAAMRSAVARRGRDPAVVAPLV